MRFLYCLLFAFSFVFSSDPFQGKWKGLPLNILDCQAISCCLEDCYQVLPNNQLSDQAKEEAFCLFQLPSQGYKSRKYIAYLFDPGLDLKPLSTRLLLDLLIDRKALAFSQTEHRYIDSLLDELIVRGFFRKIPLKVFRCPPTRKQSSLIRDIRFCCTEYLTEKINSKIDPKTQSIRLSNELNEFLYESYEANKFFAKLARYDWLKHLYLDDLSQDLLTNLLKRLRFFNKNLHVEISNSQVEFTIADLEKFIGNGKIDFKNCHNLSLGKSSQERQAIIWLHIFWLFIGYNKSNFSFQDCSLDQESLNACKDLIHRYSMPMILSLALSLTTGLFFAVGVLVINEEFPLLFKAVPPIWFIVIAALEYYKNNFSIEYEWLFFSALLFTYLLISQTCTQAITFKAQMVFLALGGIISSVDFFSRYNEAQSYMTKIMQNDFNIITKYYFLDKLCRKIF